MNIRLFSVVFAAVGSLALAACTVTEGTGTGGAGGTGGTGATGPTTSTGTSTTSTGMGGSSSSGGMGGSGGCSDCATAITVNDVSNLCMDVAMYYEALNTCACDAAKCQMDCGNGTMCAVYSGMTPPQACLDCIQMMCSTEFSDCSNH